MKGVIGIATGSIGRYRTFDKCLYKMEMPEGSFIDWQEGPHIASNFNNMVRTTLAGDYEWLWILGDDHTWHPTLLRALLERDVDIVVPLCVRRTIPCFPVIHEDVKKDYAGVGYDWLEGKLGLIELVDKTVGNAGMLVKRHVLEAMDDPWFEDGKTTPTSGGCDLWFCQKAMNMGTTVHLDLDNLMGHLTYNSIWPERDSDGMYRPKMRPANFTYQENSDVAIKRSNFEAIDGLS